MDRYHRAFTLLLLAGIMVGVFMIWAELARMNFNLQGVPSCMERLMP